MKTLENHIVLFDAECPMCRAYTSAFVKTGMLGENGRAAYQNEMDTICPIIDKQRAVNEIALVDLKNGEVTYGVKSLFKIIGNTCPLFRPLFSSEPFAWVMNKLYAFISYNRRVIIPSGKAGDAFSYQPTFKLHYRIAYLLLTWFCTSFILTRYAHQLSPAVPVGSAQREYLVCGGQIIFQAAVICFIAKDKLWNYLGNLMTISFAGAILLGLMLLVGHYVALPPVVTLLYFMLVVGLMFLEHIRRTKLLGLDWTMTASWVLYRMGILALIFYAKF